MRKKKQRVLNFKTLIFVVVMDFVQNKIFQCFYVCVNFYNFSFPLHNVEISWEKENEFKTVKIQAFGL